MTEGKKRHVVLTGEIGAGKSTALQAVLGRLGVCAQGLETYCPQARGVLPKELYMRPFGSDERGRLIAILPDGDKRGVTPLFDTYGAALLRAAKESDAALIVIDECGRLEREALSYHTALRECLDGEKPMLIVLRKLKAEWADFIRRHPAAALLEVTEENRADMPQAALDVLRAALSEK